MIIEEKDFKLIPISESSNFFDLELLYTIKPKGKEERQEFIDALGIKEPSLNRLIRGGFKLLGLITYFTAAPIV